HYSLLSLVSIFCCYLIFVFFFFFFFQAEDGIRDFHVTGVQTCALPISNTDTSRCQRMPSSRVMVGQTVTWSRPSSPTRPAAAHAFLDRKSTRLNSSHVKISYAVFCLKKKNTPVQCRTVKEVGDLMTGGPLTEAPGNGGRNYNGPKVGRFLVW